MCNGEKGKNHFIVSSEIFAYFCEGIISFISSGDFVPLENGGVYTISDLDIETSYKVKQTFIATGDDCFFWF